MYKVCGLDDSYPKNITFENKYDAMKVKITANNRLIINAVYEKGLLFIIIASLIP